MKQAVFSPLLFSPKSVFICWPAEKQLLNHKGKTNDTVVGTRLCFMCRRGNDDWFLYSVPKSKNNKKKRKKRRETEDWVETCKHEEIWGSRDRTLPVQKCSCQRMKARRLLKGLEMTNKGGIKKMNGSRFTPIFFFFWVKISGLWER